MITLQEMAVFKSLYGSKVEASSIDRINMTKFWLEQDQKNLHQQTLTLEHEQKFTPTNINY